MPLVRYCYSCGGAPPVLSLHPSQLRLWLECIEACHAEKTLRFHDISGLSFGDIRSLADRAHPGEPEIADAVFSRVVRARQIAQDRAKDSQ